MSYIQGLSDEQLLELARIIDPAATSVRVSQRGGQGVGAYLAGPLVGDDGEEWVAEDFYVLGDFDVEAYDAPHPGHDAVVRYREKMLGWLGPGYAVDYLLSD